MNQYYWWFQRLSYIEKNNPGYSEAQTPWTFHPTATRNRSSRMVYRFALLNNLKNDLLKTTSSIVNIHLIKHHVLHGFFDMADKAISDRFRLLKKALKSLQTLLDPFNICKYMQENAQILVTPCVILAWTHGKLSSFSSKNFVESTGKLLISEESWHRLTFQNLRLNVGTYTTLIPHWYSLILHLYNTDCTLVKNKVFYLFAFSNKCSFIVCSKRFAA